MPEYDIGSFPERLMSASRGLANSPQDCSPRHCGAVALFDSSSPNPKRDPCVGTRHRGLFLERLMGVEPTSSAWKADVLAVVRQPHNNSTYYTHPRGHLSSPAVDFPCRFYGAVTHLPFYFTFCTLDNGPRKPHNKY